jgi:putative molybdopterin biosynthesis protein
MAELQNHLRAIRSRLGMSQQELARTAGVTRQTIGGIEAGQYSPTAAVALKLARALGCSVEELFWLEGDLPTLEARPALGMASGPGVRVSLAQIDGRWVAHPLSGERAFRQEMAPADGVTLADGAKGTVPVQTTDDLESLARTVVLAGCTPALSLWARSAERWHPGLRVHWIHANSTNALQALARGEVHAAGMHLRDPDTGEFNAPFVRRLVPGRRVSLVNLGVWQEGLVVAPGNPLLIMGVRDLARAEVRAVNREAGSGARALLDAALVKAGIASESVGGYLREVASHQDVARDVLSGNADAGVSTESVAALYGLGFVPLESVRYDLAARTDAIDREPLRSLLSTLQHRWVRTQLRVMGGYDTSRTGEVVAVL